MLVAGAQGDEMSGETTRSSASAPRPMHGLLLALCATFWLHGAQRASAQTLGLFASQWGAGSVAQVDAGGDVALGAPFATGLSNPFDSCQREDGQLLVVEFGAGEVTDISAGGSFTGSAAFASGL